MSLVAYSDESDTSESEEVESISKASEKQKVKTNCQEDELKPEIKITDQTAVFPVSSGTKHEENADQEPFSFPTSNKAESLNGSIEATDVVDDVPTVATWNVTKSTNLEDKIKNQNVKLSSNKKPKENKLKFILPALSQFENDADSDDQSEEEVARKKLKPSNSGTGLFAVLPEPKRGPTRLVPQHVLRKGSSARPDPKPQKPSCADSDEEEGSSLGDFFSLSGASSSSSSLPQQSPLKMTFPLVNATPTHAKASPPPSFPGDNSCEREPEVSEQDASSNGAAPDLDEEALRRLAGRRLKGQVPTLIDINADDALMSRNEWVTRALCDEKPKTSFSRNRDHNPTQQQKRKHQITYLAHQAREREQELQSAWGQNRFNKMQTQSKYGF